MRCSWLGVLVLLAGCSRQEAPAFRRVALPPLENLTGDDAGAVEAQALRLAIWDGLQGQPRIFVSMAGHRRELAELGPAMVVDGYVAKNRFHLRLNDQVVACEGPLEVCLGRLTGAVGTTLAAEKRTAPKAATVRAVAKGDELGPVLKADPLFGSGWQAWAAQAQRQGGVTAALAVLEKAPMAQMTPYDAARIRVVLAELRKDKKAHAAAMLALAELSPADSDLQEKAAQEALVVRNYAGAMGLFDRLAGLTRHPRFSNQRAYAAVYAGDRAKAESAAAAAVAAAPNEPSFADTRGEVAYAFGDYAAAAQYFEAAANLNATFASGLDLWKAADAARRGGDKARAEALLQRYLDVRAKGGMRNPLLVQAVWDWHGDAPEAAAEKLRAASQSTERGKALFLLGLMALNRRDLAAAERVRRELDGNTMESVCLGALVTGAPLPPGLPFPPEAIRALQLYLKDDKAGAAKALAAAWEGIHPAGESGWRKLEALLTGARPKWQLPPSPDDWLAVLLR